MDVTLGSYDVTCNEMGAFGYGGTGECACQYRLAAQTDMTDTDLQSFMDEALVDVDGWTP